MSKNFTSVNIFRNDTHVAIIQVPTNDSIEDTIQEWANDHGCYDDDRVRGEATDDDTDYFAPRVK